MQPPEDDRGGYGELALRLALGAGKPRLRRVDLFEDAAAGFEVVAAWLGERQGVVSTL